MKYLNEKELAILTSGKGTTETNTHNFCLENKLITNDYERITIKIPQKIRAFCSSAKLLQLSHKVL